MTWNGTSDDEMDIIDTSDPEERAELELQRRATRSAIPYSNTSTSVSMRLSICGILLTHSLLGGHPRTSRKSRRWYSPRFTERRLSRPCDVVLADAFPVKGTYAYSTISSLITQRFLL